MIGRGGADSMMSDARANTQEWMIFASCWLMLAPIAQSRAGMVDPIVVEARRAVLAHLHDAEASFLGVHTKNVESDGKVTRAVCGFVREVDAASSIPWVFLESTRRAYVLTPKGDKRTVELIFAFCP